MELTQEQIEAIAKSLGEQLGQNRTEDEPDWIKDIRKITAEEGGKTKKEIQEEVSRSIAEVVMPMVKSSALSAYLEGLEPEYHEVLKEQLKDEYEKNPLGLMQAGQHELTRKMVQNSARWEGQQRKLAENKTTEQPKQTEVTTTETVSLDKQGENLAKLLAGAGVKKSGEEIAQIVEGSL